MKKFLVVTLLGLSLSANAGWFSDLKDKINDKKDEVKEESREVLQEKVRDEVKQAVGKYCFKIPLTGFYLCPPVNPDKINL